MKYFTLRAMNTHCHCSPFELNYKKQKINKCITIFHFFGMHLYISNRNVSMFIVNHLASFRCVPGIAPHRRGTSSCRWSCTWRYVPQRWRWRTCYRRCRSNIWPSEPSPCYQGRAWGPVPLPPQTPLPL